MLVENTLFGIINKVDIAIERINFAYEVSIHKNLGDLYVCFSGGKDSVVLAELCRLCKEKYDIQYTLHHNLTGLDKPELIYFMRDNYKDLVWHIYKKSLWKLIVEKHYPPTRLFRYCCSELKEYGGENKVCLTGVRWAESISRANGRSEYEVFSRSKNGKILFNDNCEGRLGFENCVIKKKLICNPIIDWDTSDVWDFIKIYNLPYCKLYDLGFKRLGCIGCPLAGSDNQKLDFKLYPKYKDAYLRAFDKMLKNHPKITSWKSAQDVMDWWLGSCNSVDNNQLSLFDYDLNDLYD